MLAVRKSRRSSRFPFWVVLTLVLGCATTAPTGYPPPAGAPAPPLDHFLCYEVIPPALSPDAPIRIRDQFDERRWSRGQVLRPLAFCNPVAKSDEVQEGRILNPDHHLVGYQLRTDRRGRPVEIENQFTGFHPVKIEVGDALWLLSPARKLYPEEHPAPVGLDHFVCYQASQEQTKNVKVDDQFTREPVAAKVGPLRALCNPADKKHRRNELYRGRPDGGDLYRHLACYEIEAEIKPPPRVRYMDQFFRRGNDLPLRRPWAICAPTKKKLAG